MPASAAASAATISISQSTTAGAERSGAPVISVAIASASISGPDIGCDAHPPTVCSSWRSPAVAPTTTIRPRTSAGSKERDSTSENE